VRSQSPTAPIFQAVGFISRSLPGPIAGTPRACCS
jgi:hypothetical protein